MNCRDLRRLEIGNIQEGVALVSKGRNFDQDDVTYPTLPYLTLPCPTQGRDSDAEQNGGAVEVARGQRRRL
jgi:hypothetical protein